MKNLPEKELFNDLESRLRQYTEEPDEKSWDQISAALHPSKPGGGRGVWFERTADLLVIALLLFLFWNSAGVGKTDVTISRESESKSIGESETENLAMEYSASKKTNEQLARSSDKMNSKDEALHTNKEVEKKEELPTTPWSTVTTKNKRRSESSDVLSDKKTSNTTFVSDQINTNSEKLDENSRSINNNISSGGENASLSSAENANSFIETEPVEFEKDSVEVKAVLPETNKTVVMDSKKEEKEQKKRKHATMYLSLTPSLAYQKMTPLKNDAVVIKSLPSESIFSSNRFGISLEAGIQKRIFKRLEVYAGASYYMQDQDISYNVQSKDNVTVETTDDLEYVVTPGVEQRTFEYSMRNIGASTGMFYLIKDGRLQHKAGIGIQYQKGLGRTSAEAGYENSSSQYLSYQLNYRMEFLLNKRTSFYVQPNFTRAFYSEETLGEPFTIKPYRAGIGFGLLYTF